MKIEINPILGNLIIDISQGSVHEVSDQIRLHPDLVNAEHPSRTPPLFFAVRHQTPQIVDRLIQHGADVNPALPGRVSLIQMADLLPDQEVYDVLKAAGAQGKSPVKLARETMPIIPTIASLTPSDLPLCRAANRPARFAELAVQFKPKRLRQLLTDACCERAIRLAKRLIEFLPTVDYCTDDEGSPLLAAALSGSLELVRALRKAGSSRELVSAFDFAVERGHVPIVKDLLPEITLKKYRNYFERDGPGMAERCAKKGYTALAELLLPYASKRSETIAKKIIQQWREDYYDYAPQCFDWPVEHSI